MTLEQKSLLRRAIKNLDMGIASMGRFDFGNASKLLYICSNALQKLADEVEMNGPKDKKEDIT